jgi:conjugal transfer pilus assembly protein TraF
VNNVSARKNKVESVGPSGMDFINEGEKGWFWYEEIPEEIEPEEVEPIEPEAEKAPEPRETPPPTTTTVAPAPKGPAPLSAEWFRKNLDGFRDKAIDKPNDENVKAYLYLQKVMMDKAETFTNKYQEMVVGDPYLDETNRYPTSNFAGKHLESAAKEKKLNLLEALSKRAGVFFFFKKDCPLCGQQAWILNEFRKQNGIDVVAISMDGSRLEKGQFKTLDDTGQSEKMDVVNYPAIVLASPPNTYKVIGQGGGYSITDIQDRMLLVAKTIGVISPEEYDQTLPVRGGLQLTDTSGSMLDEESLEDPQKMVEIIKTLTPLGY